MNGPVNEWSPFSPQFVYVTVGACGPIRTWWVGQNETCGCFAPSIKITFQAIQPVVKYLKYTVNQLFGCISSYRVSPIAVTHIMTWCLFRAHLHTVGPLVTRLWNPFVFNLMVSLIGTISVLLSRCSRELVPKFWPTCNTQVCRLTARWPQPSHLATLSLRFLEWKGEK